MKEIKFRTWDKDPLKQVDKNKNHMLYQAEVEGGGKGWHPVFEAWFDEDTGYDVDFEDVFADKKRFVLMQYTGLKDGKRTEKYPEGQEIYEGDIVRVAFNERIEYVQLCHGGDLVNDGVVTLEKLEIIGEVRIRVVGGTGFIVRATSILEREPDDKRERDIKNDWATSAGRFFKFKTTKMDRVEVIGNIYEDEKLLKCLKK